MGELQPCLEVLPAAQLKVWKNLAPTRQLGFVLYGGTAIALRLGHRVSVDFDFFTQAPLDRLAIGEAFPFLAGSSVIQDDREILKHAVSDIRTLPEVKLRSMILSASP